VSQLLASSWFILTSFPRTHTVSIRGCMMLPESASHAAHGQATSVCFVRWSCHDSRRAISASSRPCSRRSLLLCFMAPLGTTRQAVARTRLWCLRLFLRAQCPNSASSHPRELHLASSFRERSVSRHQVRTGQSAVLTA
jgi:hypothetical protein